MDVSGFFSYPNLSDADASEDLILLPDLDDHDWGKILAHTVRVRFRAREIVIQHGEAERALYIVAAGSLSVLLPESESHRQKDLAVIESGSVLGEVSFFDGAPRSASVRALTDGELIRLSFESFEVLAAREPALARSLIFDLGRILANRLRIVNAVLAG
ncbi:MAG: Crp/Fnr family transcriptional regulator [Dehalococcoidia bacterium]